MPVPILLASGHALGVIVQRIVAGLADVADWNLLDDLVVGVGLEETLEEIGKVFRRGGRSFPRRERRKWKTRLKQHTAGQAARHVVLDDVSDEDQFGGFSIRLAPSSSHPKTPWIVEKNDKIMGRAKDEHAAWRLLRSLFHPGGKRPWLHGV